MDTVCLCFVNDDRPLSGRVVELVDQYGPDKGIFEGNRQKDGFRRTWGAIR